MLSEIKKIQGWMTTDKKIHIEKKEAVQHQARLDFEEWFYECGLICDQDFDYVMDWLLESKDTIRDFLGYFGTATPEDHS